MKPVTGLEVPSVAPREPILTRDFLLLVSGHFLSGTGYASMLLLPVYLDWLDATRTEVGMVMAAAGIGGLVSRPLVGWSLDRLGRKPTLVTGILTLAVGMVLVGMVREVGPLVYAARVLIGTGIGVLFTSYFTFVSDIVPASRRTEGIALFGISGLVPLVVNPLTGRVDLPPGQLPWLFLALGGVIAVSVLFVLPVREPEPADGTDGAGFSLRAAWEAIRARQLWPVWAATTTFAGLLAVFMAFATVTASARGIEDPTAFWLAYMLAAGGVRLFAAWLPERLGPSRVLAPSLGVYVAGISVSAVTSSPTGFLLAGALAGLGHGYTFPILASQVADRSPRSLRGTALATYTALWDFTALVFVPIAGVVADRTSDGTMLGGFAVAGVVGIALWGLLELSGPVVPAQSEAASSDTPARSR